VSSSLRAGVVGLSWKLDPRRQRLGRARHSDGTMPEEGQPVQCKGAKRWTATACCLTSRCLPAGTACISAKIREKDLCTWTPWDSTLIRACEDSAHQVLLPRDSRASSSARTSFKHKLQSFYIFKTPECLPLNRFCTTRDFRRFHHYKILSHSAA
jgi:hypothetical protein